MTRAALRKQAADAGIFDTGKYVEWLEARLLDATESTKETDEDETTVTRGGGVTELRKYCAWLSRFMITRVERHKPPCNQSPSSATTHLPVVPMATLPLVGRSGQKRVMALEEETLP